MMLNIIISTVDNEITSFAVEESKVNSIFDFFYTKETEAKFKYLQAANKISKYDSEIAMNALLTNIFEEPKYSKFSFTKIPFSTPVIFRKDKYFKVETHNNFQSR